MCKETQERKSIKTRKNTTETLIKETIGGISKMTTTAAVFGGIAALMIASAIGAAILTSAIKMNREDASQALSVAFVNQKPRVI